MGEGSDGHLADLHQSAALPQPCLPGEAKGLHVGHDALEVDVETELAEAIPTQSHLWRLATSSGDLEPESKWSCSSIKAHQFLSRLDFRNTLEEKVRHMKWTVDCVQSHWEKRKYAWNEQRKTGSWVILISLNKSFLS